MSESEKTNEEPASVTLGESPRESPHKGASPLLGQNLETGPSSCAIGVFAGLVVLSLIGNIALGIIYSRQSILMQWPWVDIDSVTLTGNTTADLGLIIQMKLMGDVATGLEGELKELNADVISVDKVNKSLPEIKLGTAKLTNSIKWKIDKADKTTHFNTTFIRNIDDVARLRTRMAKDCQTAETEVRFKFNKYKLDSKKRRIQSHAFDRDVYVTVTCQFASLLEMGETHANQDARADESSEVEVMPAAVGKTSPKHAQRLIRHEDRLTVLQASTD